MDEKIHVDGHPGNKPTQNMSNEEEKIASKLRDANEPKDVHELLKGLKSWSFDIFELRKEDLPKMVEKIFEDVGIFDALPLDPTKFFPFVSSIMGQYRVHVPYHNFRHACDVLHATYLLLTLVEGEKKLNDLEIFALLLAALCHDVDHPGLNNAFLSVTNDPLAIRYNDISILESHHASTTIKTILGYESTNILANFSEAEQRYIRKLLVTIILATDMDQHFEIMETLKARNSDARPFECSPPYVLVGSQGSNGDISDGAARGREGNRRVTMSAKNPPTSSADSILLLRMIIKCADISNVMKPFLLSKRWAALLLTEWFRQGDAEKKLGLPVSKNMDSENPVALQTMTLGCIDFIGKPMYEEMLTMLPKLQDEVLKNLEFNKSEWTSFPSAGSSQATLDRILSSFDSGISVEKRPISDSAAGQKHLSSKPGRSLFRQSNNNAKGFGKNSLNDIFEGVKRTERPLSLLVGGPVEENAFISRARMSGSKLARDSIAANWDSMQPDRAQLLMSTQPFFPQNKEDGNGKMFPHSGRGMQLSFQLQSMPFPWEKSTSWEGSSNEKTLARKKSPLSIQVTSNEVSFWEILRAHPRAVKLNQFMDSKYWACLIVPAVVIALFSHNVIRAFLPKAADPYLIYIYLICLCLFTFELVTLSIVRKDYFWGLSFWLDLVGSITLIPLILGMLNINLIMARAAQAAKSFTRAAKWMQTADFSKSFIISTTKLFRRSYKVRDIHGNKEAESDSENYYKGKPSQVWTRLSELTSQKLVMGMLLLVILLPNLRVNVTDFGPISSLSLLDHSPMYSIHFNESLQQLFQFYENHGYNLLYLGVMDGCLEPAYVSSSQCVSAGQASTSECSGIDPRTDTFQQIYPPPSQVAEGKKSAEANYRSTELLTAVSESGRSEAFFSIKGTTRKALQFDLGSTILILLILSAWSFFLSWDSNKLLIQPIERMVGFVKELSEDPVSFAGKILPPKKNGDGKVMETRVVEAALIKIARLTKVALGDAGMDILSVNLKGTAFNPMIPGKKVRACFGFCDIRNFTDATECLQEDVMVFVNKIAELVHNKVIAYHGYPNKNIGDAFLLVWKKTFSDAANKKRGSSFADRALRSFLDIIFSIETSQILQSYAMHPAIQRRMPGYKIRLGFGLHVGWAIEGAIGSSHKVDPSYLSPHVNMASRLEAATKQYGVVLLLSETVFSNLTKSSLRDNCRRLDRITVKGSVEPMILYTYDMPMFQTDLVCNYLEYKNAFEEAVDNYIDGNWHEALDKLHWCLHLWPTDKPATVLINFMASHKNMVPQNWKGYRELTEK